MSRLQVQALHTRTLHSVDLDIGPGECVCLSGPSGSGKTLLLRAIADLDPHQGEVLLDGTSCRDYTPPQWRRAVAYLPAESPWWSASVGEHFTCNRPDTLHALGFDADVLGWEVERLSSGERQRLALLRLLCNEPKALLLDEPSANLDPESVGRVEHLIQTYRAEHDAAVLWVSHDPAQIRRVATRAVRIRAGALEQAS